LAEKKEEKEKKEQPAMGWLLVGKERKKQKESLLDKREGEGEKRE
jgi:hypothetical protein